MVSRSLGAQRMSLTLLVAVLLPFMAGCDGQQSGGGSTGGDITILQNDRTAPTLTLGAGKSDGRPANVTVNDGGSGQSMKLTTKTGAMNLVATANDAESGVQALEIWLDKKTTSCDANGNCSTTQELGGKPLFESTSPQKQPGETAWKSSALVQALDLSNQIPQGSVSGGNTLTVDFMFYAVAVNYLSGRFCPEVG